METLLAVFAGVGLAAAAGFRVFVPFFVMGLAARTGQLDLADGFEWIASSPAIVAFGLATLLEVGAYWVPWIDHLLDVVLQPIVLVAGVLAAGAVATDLSPFLKWTLAVIAGGGAASVVQGGSMLARASSTATTGGLANFVVSSIELAGATLTSLAAVFVPVLVVVGLAAATLWVAPRVARRRRA